MEKGQGLDEEEDEVWHWCYCMKADLQPPALSRLVEEGVGQGSGSEMGDAGAGKGQSKRLLMLRERVETLIKVAIWKHSNLPADEGTRKMCDIF